MVIWITGLSGSGKSTVADAMIRMLKPHLPELVLLDGDVIRALFGKNLDYSEPSRVIQVERLRTMAKLLSEQGLVVIVTVLYCHPDLMSWNRVNIRDYFEIYMDAPMDVLMARDVKGLYSKAKRGEMPNVVGLDVPWHSPENPDLHVRSDNGENPEAYARRIIEACPRLARVMAAEKGINAL